MEITNELAQALVNYLGTKPYGEVYQLIGMLQQQAQVKPEAKVEPEAPKEDPKEVPAEE